MCSALWLLYKTCSRSTQYISYLTYGEQLMFVQRNCVLHKETAASLSGWRLGRGCWAPHQSDLMSRWWSRQIHQRVSSWTRNRRQSAVSTWDYRSRLTCTADTSWTLRRPSTSFSRRWTDWRTSGGVARISKTLINKIFMQLTSSISHIVTSFTAGCLVNSRTTPPSPPPISSTLRTSTHLIIVYKLQRPFNI